MIINGIEDNGFTEEVRQKQIKFLKGLRILKRELDKLTEEAEKEMKVKKEVLNGS